MKGIMRFSARSSALIVSALLAVSLSGCTVDIVDPGTVTPNESPPHSDPQLPSTPQPTTDRVPSADHPALSDSGYSDPVQAAFDQTLGSITMTVPCNSPVVIDQTAVTVRVEGSCEQVTVHADAAVVILEDVGELTLTGSGTVIFARKLSELHVSGDINEVYWQGVAPKTTDNGSGNIITRG